MVISTFPTATGGGIKLVQRGSAASAGTVTITAVDITKSFVNVFGTASSGTVAATGTIASVNFGSQLQNQGGQGLNTSMGTSDGTPSSTLSGGTNNLVTAVVQGYLSGSTSLVVSGACRWEVVEFA